MTVFQGELAGWMGCRTWARGGGVRMPAMIGSVSRERYDELVKLGRLTGLSNPKLIRKCSELESADGTAPAAAVRHTLRLLARRIQHLTEEINDLTARITAAITVRAPKFLGRYGVGPDTAAALLIAAGDNPDRMGSEASFAALCGVSPVEASSGKTQRRRLNRGGDRQANSALYAIVLARLRWDTCCRRTS